MTMNRRITVNSPGVLGFSEVPVPDAPAQGAVVKIMFAGICHSDIHHKNRPFSPKFEFPRVLGHEISGTVHSIGEDAKKARPDLSLGDNVCVFPWGMCQECNNCAANYPFCTTMHYGRGPVGAYVYGIWRDGGYQNYIVIDLVRFLEKVPSNIPMDTAAILTCSGLTSYNAISALDQSISRAIEVNDSGLVALIGAGGLALWAIQILKVIYPSKVKVAVVDISSEKLEDAKDVGADFVHKWGTTESAEEAVEGLIRTCQGRPDAIIDYIGLASVIERAHLSLNIGGTLALVGLSGTMLPEITLNSVIRRNISIKGIINGSQPQCREVIKMVKEGMLKPPPITHVTLDEVPQTMDKLQKGQQRGRAVIKMY